MPRLTLQSRTTALTLAAALAITPHLTLAATPTSYIGPDNGLWTDPANWSAGVPNSGSFDALVNSPLPLTVQLDASQSISNLTLNAPNTLVLLNKLTLNGSMSNTGTLVFNATSYATLFQGAWNLAISGGGTMLMSGTASDITNDLAFSSLLGSRSFTTDNLITGQGNIGNISSFRLINNGTIVATTGILSLQAYNPIDLQAPIVNNGLMRADGGTLRFTAFQASNTNGIIEAAANSLVSFAGISVTGGIVRALSGGTVALGSASMRSLTLSGYMVSGTASGASVAMCTSSAYIMVPSASNLTVGIASGSSVFSNVGTLSLAGTLTLQGTLTGGGIVLPANGRINCSGAVSNNVISGSGLFFYGSNFSNTGTITASGSTLALQTGSSPAPISNAGILRADGGTLVLQSQVINTGGLIEATNNSIVAVQKNTFNNATWDIQGGTLRATNGGTLTLYQVHKATLDLTDPSGNVAFFYPTPSTPAILDSVTYNGNVQINGTLQSATPSVFISGATVNGTTTLTSCLLNAGTLSGPGNLALIKSVLSQGLVNNLPISGEFSIDPAGGTITNKASMLGNSGKGISLNSINGTSTTRFFNQGTLTADTVPMVLGGTVSNLTGLIELKNGAPLTVYGTVSGGTLSISSMSTVTLSPVIIGPTPPLSGVTLVSTPALFKGTVGSNPSTITLSGAQTVSSLTSLQQVSLLAVSDTTLTGGTLTGIFRSVIGTFSNAKLTNNATLMGSLSMSVATLTNNSLIEANSGGISIAGFLSSVATLNNNGILRANGGTLVLGGSSVQQIPFLVLGGIIDATNSSNAFINAATVSGTTLTTSVGGSITLGQFARLSDFTLNGTLINANPANTTFAGNIVNNGILRGGGILAGTITNAGLMQLGTSSDSGGTLTISTDSALLGTGSLTMTSNLSSRISTATASVLSNAIVIAGAGVIQGNLTNAGTVTANAGPGTTLTLGSNSPATLTINTGIIRADGGLLVLAGSVNNDGGTIEALNNSNVSITGQVSGGTLHLASAATLAFSPTPAPRNTPAVLLQAASLSLAPTTTLDLSNHDLLIHSGSTSTFESQIGSAYFFGLWNHPGITSSSAQANPITTLAIMSGADYNTFSPTPGTFDSTPVLNSDTVLKFTYVGDLNLDGLVNDDDLFIFNGDYFFTGTGNYALGDLNFDGLVNDDDLFLFNGNYFFPPATTLADLSLVTQSQIENQNSKIANLPTPEPTTLLLLSLTTPLLLLRRPRHPFHNS